jgi:hypothetical protein
VIHGKESHELKQARELGMEELTVSLQSLGFTKSIADSNLYIKIVQNHPVILVDDLFLTGKENLIAQTKRELFSRILK